MAGSILIEVKKFLGLDSAYEAFDLDIKTHINTVFTGLSAIGIGPAGGFMIEDNRTTWDEFIGTDLDLNSVKTYMYLRVRMIFDPPTVGYVIDATKEEIKKLEWLLNVKREGESWVDPTPVTQPTDRYW